METRIYNLDEIKGMFLQELINKVDGKISKISDHSVLNGIAYGCAKVLQKSMKDVAILESELFPEYAYGEYLDKIALRYGISERRKYAGSSVYVKIVADAGSTYLANTCRFISTEGITFELENNFTVNANGWGYAKLKSAGMGSNTNVAANTITKITGQPAGHKYVINELPATGGVDTESDMDLMQRILQSFGSFSFETLDRMTAVFQKINSRVLLVKKLSVNDYGQIVLGIASTNGVAFTSTELTELEEKGRAYLSMQDVLSASESNESLSPIIVQNMQEVYLDLDFRVALDSETDVDDFRVAVQQQIVDHLSFTRNKNTTIAWEDIYAIVRSQSGVKALPETMFYVGDSDTWTQTNHHQSIGVKATEIARVRMFVVRDENGLIISNNQKVLVPYYYGSDYTNIFDEINNSL